MRFESLFRAWRAHRRAWPIASTVLALGASTACSTPLLATSIEATTHEFETFRRGGAALGCHEQESEHFRVYLVCPGKKGQLGISDSRGHLAFSCPSMRIHLCRAFADNVRAAAASAQGEGPSDATTPRVEP